MCLEWRYYPGHRTLKPDIVRYKVWPKFSKCLTSTAIAIFFYEIEIYKGSKAHFEKFICQVIYLILNYLRKVGKLKNKSKQKQLIDFHIIV